MQAVAQAALCNGLTRCISAAGRKKRTANNKPRRCLRRGLLYCTIQACYKSVIKYVAVKRKAAENYACGLLGGADEKC